MDIAFPTNRILNKNLQQRRAFHGILVFFISIVHVCGTSSSTVHVLCYFLGAEPSFRVITDMKTMVSKSYWLPATTGKQGLYVMYSI